MRAVPGTGARVPVWILGSSLYGANLAASLGLPYAFASHFAPGELMGAIDQYRARFQASERQPRPEVMLGVNVIAAENDREAQRLATSLLQAFVRLRSGRPSELPRPSEGFESRLSSGERAQLDQFLKYSFIGSRETIRQGLQGFLRETGADEIIVSSAIHDPDARVRSYEILAEIRDSLD